LNLSDPWCYRVRAKRDEQRFRGGLVFKAHRLCVSLNSRLESKKEEEKKRRQLERFPRLEPESQGLNLALTVLYVPYRGTSLIRTPPPPDHHRALGIGLL